MNAIKMFWSVFMSNDTIWQLTTDSILALIKELNTELKLRKKNESWIEDDQVKLPHWQQPMYLTGLRLRIIRAAWGNSYEPPPLVTWSQLQRTCFSGAYCLTKAFGSGTKWQDFFVKVGYGKYQLRRGVNEIRN
jgi:hypothetical protein